MDDWPLVGREAELRALDRALQGHGAVFVLGEVGCGKSRLVRALLDQVASDPVVVVATAASRDLPLGAFAPVLPQELPTDPLERLRVATAHLEERGDLLVVDDAHLLDTASATLLQQLLEGGRVPVVGTVRTGEPLARDLAALWSGDARARITLGPLDRGSTRELLEHALVGPVTPGTEHAIWEHTRGSPLALRELLRILTETGAVRQIDGVWRLDAIPEIPRATAEMIAARVADLAPELRAAFELLALGEPLPLAAITDLDLEVACEELEELGLVALVDRYGVSWVRPHHPLHGEAIRAMMPQVRRARHRRRLAEVARLIEPWDPIRAASWQLDAGRDVDPDLLRRAARVAHGVDPDIALRFATAAVAAAPTTTNLAVLAQATASGGDPIAALEVAHRAAAAAVDDQDRAELAVTVVRTLVPPDATRAEAAGLVEELLDQVADPGAADRIETELAAWAAAIGPRDAIAGAVERVLERADAAPPAVLAATTERLMFGLFAGRTDEVDQQIAEAASLAAELDDPFHGPLLAAVRSTWSCLVGRIDDAIAQDRRVLAAAIAEGDPTRRGMAAVWLAVALEFSGALDEALGALLDVEPLLEHAQPYGLRHFHPALTATLQLQRGEEAAGQAALAGLPPPALEDLRVRAWVSRAQVWAAALAGDLDTEQRSAQREVDHLEEQGWLVYAALVAFDLVRLGRPVASVAPLTRFAAAADESARMLHLMAAQAVAAADGDGAALDEVADGWASTGSYLFAAEAAGGASIRHALAGRPDLAARSAVRAASWVERCPGAATPALLGWRSPLTDREREVARFAAAGASSREIAETLVISVRTVDNHLASVYRKVGIGGREDLPTALGLPAAPEPQANGQVRLSHAAP